MSIHTPWVSHLLFADDCLVFSQASVEGALRLQNLLQDYRQGSVQLVNKSKLAIFFSSNCCPDLKLEVLDASGIPSEALGEKYLAFLLPWEDQLMRCSSIFLLK